MADSYTYYVPNLGGFPRGAWMSGTEFKRIRSTAASTSSWLSDESFSVISPILQVWLAPKAVAVQEKAIQAININDNGFTFISNSGAHSLTLPCTLS